MQTLRFDEMTRSLERNMETPHSSLMGACAWCFHSFALIEIRNDKRHNNIEFFYLTLVSAGAMPLIEFWGQKKRLC